MKRCAFLASTAALLLSCSPGLAETVLDCPQAGHALDSRSPLSDVLAHPGGRAALNAAAPGLLDGITRTFGALPPGFANILTPEALFAFSGMDPAVATRVDDALAALPVDAAFDAERCARYDHDRPPLPESDGRPALLVFEKITGFRDEPSLAAAREALARIASARGWQLVFTQSGGSMNSEDLSRFAAVVWNNVSGDALTVPQRQAFREYIAAGGGFVGIHGAGGDPRYFWDWYADTLIGARFIGHPMNPQFQTSTVSVVDQRSEIAQGLPAAWPLLEEWYSFDRNPADGGAVVVATIDESQYNPIGFGGQNLAMGPHPIAWRKFVGDGRSFYTAIGHRPENYTQADAERLLANGIAWAMGD